MDNYQLKTSLLIGAVVLAHGLAISGVFLIQGCGTTRGPVDMPTETPMPPTVLEEPETPARVAAESVQTQPSVVKTSVYVVGKGDCLSRIAARFDLTVAEIMTLNNIDDPNKIRMGQKLILPGELDIDSRPRPLRSTPARAVAVPAGATTYVVKSGDCLSVIASRFGSSVSLIRDANGISGDRIRVGQKLVIPGGRAAPAGPASASFEPSDTSSEAINLEEGFAPISIPDDDATSLDRAPEGVALSPERTHIVTEGEDLLDIASQWNVSIAELKKLNRLSDTPLRVGQRLRIPSSE